MLASFQRPAADGWRYNASHRTRKAAPGEWPVERWDGSAWVPVETAADYAEARLVASERKCADCESPRAHRPDPAESRLVGRCPYCGSTRSTTDDEYRYCEGCDGVFPLELDELDAARAAAEPEPLKVPLDFPRAVGIVIPTDER